MRTLGFVAKMAVPAFGALILVMPRQSRPEVLFDARCLRFAAGSEPRSVVLGDWNSDGRLDAAVGGAVIWILFGNGDGTFAPSQGYDIGRYLGAIAAGDVNGDGHLDLVGISAESRTVTMLFGSTDGTFVASGSYETGQYPAGIALSDLNGDGRLDLAVANSGESSVSVFLGAGGGKLGLKSDYRTSRDPQAVAAADVTGDGNSDLLVLTSTHALSILRGLGDGTFAPRVDSPVQNDIRTIAVGDVTGDGRPDLVLEGYYHISVLAGGPGGLKSPANYRTKTEPQALAIADINADKKPDIVFITEQRTVSSLLAKGAGGFVAGEDLEGIYKAAAFAPGDLNGDGILDFVMADPAGNSIAVVLGHSVRDRRARRFMAGFDCRGVAVADLDADGKLDVVVADEGTLDRPGAVAVLLGAGDGTFGASKEYGRGNHPMDVAIADFDADGKPDLAVAKRGGAVSVLLGTGGGAFGSATEYTTGPGSTTVAAADVDGDGDIDLAVVNSGSAEESDNNDVAGSVSLLLNDGHGGFASKLDFAAGGSSRGIAIGDVDGDGYVDLVVGNEGGDVGSCALSILKGTGGGAFVSNCLPAAHPSSAVALHDINGDGKLDLATVSRDGVATILFGTGTGTFVNASDYPVGGQPAAVAFVDLNGDGKPDLAVGGALATIAVLEGKTDGTFGVPVGYEMPAQGRSFAFADLDRDGRPDAITPTFDGISVLMHTK